MRVILAGNPNVGKSIVFSYLTGYTAISSNYPGTTVEVLKGKTKLADRECEIIDVPGCYSLEGESVAEKIANEIITKKDYDIIFNIVDANNLERNLFLTLQLIEIGKPMIIILTKCDIAKNKGIVIDYKKLAELLGVDVVGVVATAGIGFDLLKSKCYKLFSNISEFISKINVPKDNKEKWKKIGEISLAVQKIVHKHPTFLEKLEEYTTTPSTAIPIAIILVFTCFYIIRVISEFFINNLLDPFFNNYYLEFVKNIGSNFKPGLLRDLVFSRSIIPLEGFSILTTGLYIPFVIVFPYIVTFYIVLGILEDIGYLPRLAVILDRLSHKIGLHGYGTIPLIMGLGCKVPGIFSLRILETEREKIIAASLMFLISPCVPQTAMIISVMSQYPSVYTFFIFFYLFGVGFIASYLLNKILKGTADDLFMEIPPYHKPNIKNLYFKLKIRIKEFLIDAIPFIIGGIFFINLIDVLGIFSYMTRLLGPFFSYVLNLPSETSAVFVLGFLKKDVSISLLMPFNLSAKDTIVMSFVLVTYLPCLASIFVLIKELGKRVTFYVILFNIFISLFFATILSFMLNFIL